MMTNPDPASAVASAAIAAAAAGPLSKLVTILYKLLWQLFVTILNDNHDNDHDNDCHQDNQSHHYDANACTGWWLSDRLDKFHHSLLAPNNLLLSVNFLSSPAEILFRH